MTLMVILILDSRGLFFLSFSIKICIKEGEKITYDFKCTYDIKKKYKTK